MPSLFAAATEHPVALDGGLGTLLAEDGHDLSSDLWSARLLRDDPAAIRSAHRRYLDAGARVLITASYQVSFERLGEEGVGRDEAVALFGRSVELAREARAEAGRGDPREPDATDPAWVAASVGPYGAMLADGSEYTGRYGLGVAELRAWHRPRLEALAAAGPDLFAAETIPSLVEVEALCAELDTLGVPAWLSVTVADGALRTGESLADAVALAEASSAVQAIGVNCCAPGEVAGAIATIRAGSAKPIVVYPNSGEVWDGAARSWRGSPDVADGLVAEWVAGGAALIGGCCRLGPAQIRRIADDLAAIGAGAP